MDWSFSGTGPNTQRLAFVEGGMPEDEPGVRGVWYVEMDHADMEEQNQELAKLVGGILTAHTY